MHKFNFALLLAALAVPATAQVPIIGVAINGERETPFKDLAECEMVLLGSRLPETAARPAGAANLKGSLFNRRAGNLSVCAMVHGEPKIVVYPRRTSVERRGR